MRRLLQYLQPQYRLAIVLRYWHDKSYTEIAEITGTTESAVKSRLHRAREAMAELLAAEEQPMIVQEAEQYVRCTRGDDGMQPSS